MNSLILLFPVFFPVLAGFASFVLPFRKQRGRNLFVMVSLLLSAAGVWTAALTSPEGTFTVLRFTDELSIALRLDGAGKLFACLSATLWPLTALYAFEYMKHEKHLKMFYAFFTAAFGTVMGIAFSENMLTMYLFYEMLTVSTIPLVMHGMTHKHRFAARRYMIYSIGGAAFAFAGVSFLIINSANSFVFGGSLKNMGEGILPLAVFLATFMGFGVKAAVFPLHKWLPTASVAPTPVTALLHAVAVVKAGAFAIIRLVWYSFGTENLKGSFAHYFVMAVCMLTIVYGSANALRQVHFKRRLAFSTVANLSYITFAVTLMTPAGLVAAFCHMIFHSVIKIGAFFSAGAVLHNTGKEYVLELEGLGRKMPLTFGCYTVYALALTGVPVFCGFFSKWYIASAAISEGSVLAVVGVIALLISAFLTSMYMLSPAIRAFFPRDGKADVKGTAVKTDVRMLIPMVLCAVGCIVLGIFAGQSVGFIGEVLGL